MHRELVIQKAFVPGTAHEDPRASKLITNLSTDGQTQTCGHRLFDDVPRFLLCFALYDANLQ